MSLISHRLKLRGPRSKLQLHRRCPMKMILTSISIYRPLRTQSLQTVLTLNTMKITKMNMTTGKSQSLIAAHSSLTEKITRMTREVLMTLKEV